MRLVLTGGGTGGHIYPALAIGREAAEREPDSSLLYIGTTKGLESRIVPNQGIPFESIDITGFRRSLSMENVKTIVRFLQGVKRSKELLRSFKPDAVVGTGGYVCGPVVYAASRLGIPTLIHEQNVVPGLTNKFLSRYADAVAVSFADSLPHFSGKRNVLHAGNPVASMVAKANRSEGFKSLGLPEGTPFVLAVGGSRGAKALNEAILEMLPGLESLADVHFVFVTGERYYEEALARLQELPAKVKGRVHALHYINNMPEVLSAASLVVSRAGASSLAEITSLGIPSILVPSPNVTNNHQQPNAESLAVAGAAVMILEKDLNGGALLSNLSAIMKDRSRREAMAVAARKLGMPKAASAIYEQIKGILK
ncbi:undecaprenyldiphospho-muramoylpentapeptide beta-N-acetylglucosaminyltransferase [Cohnella thailandensis]|uniref:UDP-N-acetylglucosamine--N-acetylmuramyl-(pentapeptide) pyrophosphoryl-undecaprenol N-acetylglucosamine transferase n=1 Tax=Cohnella thailandensis TaxID=557557 RepID=A0A841T1P4_9BACL|nr:undecaprenyldiphospho-muramoylpentapeptide beta-N-acetylglucosaminyltransferase [Cohnella thailandensis]MBB6636308.1 undecaprenyldiphospho-muramoylpentapeptide beta-N-acetylglucosaminyltransferase [Cohnella thailandensis]MBP1973723.1 UDP-N-acetylglucosamine--N-acetylmuramyl-(pentapeptide) pyrophosphoryl-undecaprenol N-acetylglucosamine transferase [Cohnella thailandensis]